MSWDRVNKDPACNTQIKLLNNVWCFNCRKTTGIGGDVSGKISKGMLVLHGKFTSCGEAVTRVIDKYINELEKEVLTMLTGVTP